MAEMFRFTGVTVIEKVTKVVVDHEQRAFGNTEENRTSRTTGLRKYRRKQNRSEIL
jgi:hypothetical protein